VSVLLFYLAQTGNKAFLSKVPWLTKAVQQVNEDVKCAVETSESMQHASAVIRPFSVHIQRYRSGCVHIQYQTFIYTLSV